MKFLFGNDVESSYESLLYVPLCTKTVHVSKIVFGWREQDCDRMAKNNRLSYSNFWKVWLVGTDNHGTW